MWALISAFFVTARIMSGTDVVLNMYLLEGRNDGSDFLKGYDPIKIDHFDFSSSVTWHLMCILWLQSGQ